METVNYLKTWGLVCLCALLTKPAPAIIVDVYREHTQTDGGAPYDDLAGSFYSPDIMFWTNAEHYWFPYDLPDFGAEITGRLLVEETGTYPFEITTDDGSMVYIDDQLVMDYGGEGLKHGTEWITLTAGTHNLRVEFFEDWDVTSGIDLVLPPDVEYGKIILEKTDDVTDPDCRMPSDPVTYTICWENKGLYTFENAFIIDFLPDGVDYPAGADSYVFDGNSIQLVESDPGYNEEGHFYVWELGTIYPDDANCVTLNVVVNDKALPGMFLHNAAELWADDGDTFVTRAFEDTRVCCWGDPNVIYVDRSATGYNSGTSWTNAYVDLADALDRARYSICGGPFTIYVAQGVYTPAGSPEDGFVLPDGASVYGGFPAGGGALNQRNQKTYKTVLTGLIDPNTLTRADTVVTMADETLLDEFTITQSDFDGYGIYASGADFSVVNSKIELNGGYGAYIEDGNATFRWCHFTSNKRDGIYHSGTGYTLSLENCWIQRSQRNGLFCQNSIPILRNSNITESDMAREGRSGIRMVNPSSQPILQNCTIAHNKAVGVLRTGGVLPDVKNSIVYHNGGPALAGFSAEQVASYCCIEDCNEVNNNINDDPEFVYFDPNNIRIKIDSPCHDSGLTLQENYAQVDMDNRTRVLGIAVDRGAYEIECEDTSNSFDTNHNGLVNLHEFSAYSRAWLSRDPNDPSIGDPSLIDPNDFIRWNPACDLNGDYTVSLPDIVMFIDEAPWLWRACWLTDDYLFEMMGGGDMLMMESVIPAQAGAEIPVAEQIARLAKSIIFLERIWLEYPDFQDEIDVETWNVFMDSLYQELIDLYMGPE